MFQDCCLRQNKKSLKSECHQKRIKTDNGLSSWLLSHNVVYKVKNAPIGLGCCPFKGGGSVDDCYSRYDIQ